ncbi:MAG: tetratricopeptide repeat protein [Hyphomicrobiaceae bacterium]
MPSLRCAAVMALALLPLCLTSAFADALDDCRRARNADARLTACSAVIASATSSADARAQAYRHRGRARSEAGATVEALADFTAAIELKPDYWAAWAGRGAVLVSRGEPSAALASYDAAIRHASDAARFQLHLERGHAYLAIGNADAALLDFTEAVRRNPRSAVALNNRGLAYRRNGDLDRAWSDYTAAIQLNPMYAQAYANRGYLDEARGRTDDARWNLKQALMIDPSLTSARQALARLGIADEVTREADARVAAGKGLAEQWCARCHAVGPTGESPNPKAPPMRAFARRHPLLALREPVERGIAAPHDEMPRFTLADAEVDSIVAYVNSLAAR